MLLAEDEGRPKGPSRVPRRSLGTIYGTVWVCGPTCRSRRPLFVRRRSPREGCQVPSPAGVSPGASQPSSPVNLSPDPSQRRRQRIAALDAEIGTIGRYRLRWRETDAEALGGSSPPFGTTVVLHG
jgi:hypothetical protein